MKFLLGKILMLSLYFALCSSFLPPETTCNLSQTVDSVYACPRCRRNLPKGPKKRPTPPGPRSDRKKSAS